MGRRLAYIGKMTAGQLPFNTKTVGILVADLTANPPRRNNI